MPPACLPTGTIPAGAPAATAAPRSVDVFWQVLADAGADVILNGHDHTYERLADDGMRQFVVGTGGDRCIPSRSRRCPRPRSRSRPLPMGCCGSPSVPGAYEWEFLALGDSGFTDAGSGDCG